MEQYNYYSSSFEPSVQAISVLRNGKIIDATETPAQMVERVINDLLSIEVSFGTSTRQICKFGEDLGQQMDSSKIVFSTPIMTNAFKSENRPLSACSVPPVDLRGDMQQVKRIVDIYHQEAMGTGFDLSNVEDPVSVLLFLNETAVKGVESGREDRPVGNMATCSIDHPKIAEFIKAKSSRRNEDWKFNISVDAPESFWNAVRTGSSWILKDGTEVKAVDIFQLLAESAHSSADPGIICLDRLNQDNPTPGIGLYTSTAPCAEVGLVPGETCQFGYINLAKFVASDGANIDYQSLMDSSKLMVRALDNALELSIGRYEVPESSRVMSAKRKIGVGICGLADLLVQMGIPYDSDRGRVLARDLVSFINYQTKLASMELAKTRGSFGAMNLAWGCRYNDEPGFLEQKYGELNTGTVSASEWQTLGGKIRETKLLRNCSTIALPPTGRSGLVISASTGVEPLFTLLVDGRVHSALEGCLRMHNAYTHENIVSIMASGSCQDLDLPMTVKEIFLTATEISTFGHLAMVAAIQPCVDESISKTINLPTLATVEDVKSVYLRAYDSGLKGMTIYRNGSSRLQPRKVVS